jgi:hypothetical protein
MSLKPSARTGRQLSTALPDLADNFNRLRCSARANFSGAPMNPFANRAVPLSGPATDALPVTPSDTTDLPHVALGIYVSTGGTISIVTVAGETRTLMVADFSILPVGVRRVRATGTTAAGIHALVLA